MKINRFILLALMASTFGCGRSDFSPSPSQIHGGAYQDQNGVIGGEKVDSNSAVARHTVGIKNFASRSICSGTLIAQNAVLTAAHCLESDAKDIAIVFNSRINGIDRRSIRMVQASFVHPEYDSSGSYDTHDIGILIFEGKAPAGFSPAPLSDNYNDLTYGKQLRVAGYGLNWAWGPKLGAGILRTVRLKIRNLQFSNTEFTLDHSLKRGVCSGDSGGPVYIERGRTLVTAGVISRGDSIPVPLIPKCFLFSIVTRVDAHLPWITGILSAFGE